jgi:hypothetical protein
MADGRRGWSIKPTICAGFLAHPSAPPQRRRSKLAAASRTRLVPLGALAAQSGKRPRRAPAQRAAAATHPPAIIATPASAAATPARCTVRIRSPSTARASTTVATGYSEPTTATMLSAPFVFASA